MIITTSLNKILNKELMAKKLTATVLSGFLGQEILLY